MFIHSSSFILISKKTIQPVIQKETVQPSVVHTTIPVHEVHHNEAKHHTASALPAVTMDEFKSKGGSLAGREERVDSFGGEPRTVGSTLGGHGAKGSTSLTESDGKHHNGVNGHEHNGVNGHHHNGVDGHHSNGATTDRNLTTGSGPGMTGNNVAAGGVGSTGTHSGTNGTSHSGTTGTSGYDDTNGNTHKKASLMDKINPKVDANGDGVAGFMK